MNFALDRAAAKHGTPAAHCTNPRWNHESRGANGDDIGNVTGTIAVTTASGDGRLERTDCGSCTAKRPPCKTTVSKNASTRNTTVSKNSKSSANSVRQTKTPPPAEPAARGTVPVRLRPVVSHSEQVRGDHRPG